MAMSNGGSSKKSASSAQAIAIAIMRPITSLGRKFDRASTEKPPTKTKEVTVRATPTVANA